MREKGNLLSRHEPGSEGNLQIMLNRHSAGDGGDGDACAPHYRRHPPHPANC